MIKAVFGVIFVSIAAFIILVLASLGFGIVSCNKVIYNVLQPKVNTMEKEKDFIASNIKASIEQEVKRSSYLNNTWKVETNIWTMTKDDKIQTLEYHSVAFVKFEDLDKVKTEEYEKALPYLSKLNKLLEEDNNVKNK